MSELKTCPFCGDTLIAENDTGQVVFVHPRRRPKSKCFISYMIVREPLFDIWNTRAPDPRIAELEAALDQSEEGDAPKGMWRFWSDKAQTLASKNVAYGAQIKELEAEVERLKADNAELDALLNEGSMEGVHLEATDAAKLIAENATLKEQLAGKWLPIKSAPDDTAILLWWPHWWHTPIIGYRRNFTWHAHEALNDHHVDHPLGPLKWQPLPPAPKGG